jgi:hypothetical protein
VGAEKEALMAARGRETTEQLQEMLKSAAKVLDEVRLQLASSEASASDYAHKCDVLAASLRDSQAHCRDLEKQISSALSQVAHGHDAVRRLQDEVGTKDAELSSEQSQSRDLRTQIESLVSQYKMQAEVRFWLFLCLNLTLLPSRLLTGVCTRFVWVTFKFISIFFVNLL